MSAKMAANDIYISRVNICYNFFQISVSNTFRRNDDIFRSSVQMPFNKVGMHGTSCFISFLLLIVEAETERSVVLRSILELQGKIFF